MVESHANLRMLARRRPSQLVRLVVALQGHRLTVLHLNITSAGHMALYSLNLKVVHLPTIFFTYVLLGSAPADISKKKKIHSSYVICSSF